MFITYQEKIFSSIEEFGDDFFFLNFLAALCGMWDLSFLTRH